VSCSRSERLPDGPECRDMPIGSVWRRARCSRGAHGGRTRARSTCTRRYSRAGLGANRSATVSAAVTSSKRAVTSWRWDLTGPTTGLRPLPASGGSASGSGSTRSVAASSLFRWRSPRTRPSSSTGARIFSVSVAGRPSCSWRTSSCAAAVRRLH